MAIYSVVNSWHEVIRKFYAYENMLLYEILYESTLLKILKAYLNTLLIVFV